MLPGARDDSTIFPATQRPGFGTTHWSVVLATRDVEPAQAAKALARLCGTYWYPIYVYLRRRGLEPADAEDLAQGFLAELLAHEAFQRADPAKGRFRTFLLVSLNHYLQRQADRDRRQKRGGGALHISLDGVSAEERYRLEPIERYTPDQLFERRWALTVVETALEQLKIEVTNAGYGPRFAQLKGAILGDRLEPSYAEVGRKLGMSAGTVAVTVHRWRQRYRELCRAEVAQTVQEPAEVEAEMRHLFEVLIQ